MSAEKITWEDWVAQQVTSESIEELRALFREVKEPSLQGLRCFFHFVGPPATGKSIVARALSNYIGVDDVAEINGFEAGKKSGGMGYLKRLVVIDDLPERVPVLRGLHTTLDRVIYNQWALPNEVFEEQGGELFAAPLLLISHGGRFDLGSIFDLEERRIEFRNRIPRGEIDVEMGKELAADSYAIARWANCQEGDV